MIENLDNPAPTPPMLTTADLALRLAVSERTALRIMRETAGVLHLGTGSRAFYRMPETVFNAFVNRKSAKAVKIPPRRLY
jgi:hypothetical protein